MKKNEMEKFWKDINRRRDKLNLPKLLTDGQGHLVRVNKKGKFLRI